MIDRYDAASVADVIAEFGHEVVLERIARLQEAGLTYAAAAIETELVARHDGVVFPANADASVRALIDAARALFAKDGYDETAIADICRVSDVGADVFDEVFGTKEACYIAVLDDFDQTFRSHLAQKLARLGPANAAEATFELVALFTHELADDPRIGRMYFTAYSSPAVDRERRITRRATADFLVGVWRFFDRLEPAPDHVPAALGLVGGVYEIIQQWLLDVPDRPALHEIEQLLADLTAFTDHVVHSVVRRATSRPR